MCFATLRLCYLPRRNKVYAEGGGGVGGGGLGGGGDGGGGGGVGG